MPFQYKHFIGVKGLALASTDLSGTGPVKDREKGGRSGRRRRAPGPRRGAIVPRRGWVTPPLFAKVQFSRKVRNLAEFTKFGENHLISPTFMRGKVMFLKKNNIENMTSFVPLSFLRSIRTPN